MARDILVYASNPSCDPTYFEAFLGSEGSVREYWSEPGEQLGLMHLASIYERGFYEGIEWSGAMLDDIWPELDCLEDYWRTQNYSRELAAQLGERIQGFREALVIAKERDCVLSIS